MAIESGIGVYASFAPEGTYGTYTETNQIFIPIISESMTQAVERIDRSAEATGKNRWMRKPVQGRFMPVEGSIKFFFYLDDIAGYILRAMLGAATNATLSGTAYSHYWYPVNSQNNSLSIEIRRGANSTPWRFAGCKIKTTKWELDNQGILTCVIGLIAQQYSQGNTDSVTGLGTTIAPRFFESTLTDDGGSAQAVKKWSFEVDMGLNTSAENLFKWGQQYIIEPTPTEQMKITGSVEFLFDSTSDHARYTAYRALTEYDRLVTMTTTQAIPGGSGGEVYLFKIETPVIIMDEYTPPQYGGPGVMLESHTFGCYEGTTNNGNSAPFEITVQNGTASYS